MANKQAKISTGNIPKSAPAMTEAEHKHIRVRFREIMARKGVLIGFNGRKRKTRKTTP